ncbi:uncharacterized protein [Porites lutea]|uniref:uncharacterized protein isoform X2 n=1 Tax=Porites lutea TaxID=51062 RepID=UPI003CC5F06B
MVKSPLLLLVLETDNIKQRTSLLSVQSKICLLEVNDPQVRAFAEELVSYLQNRLAEIDLINPGLDHFDRWDQMIVLTALFCALQFQSA